MNEAPNWPHHLDSVPFNDSTFSISVYTIFFFFLIYTLTLETRFLSKHHPDEKIGTKTHKTNQNTAEHSHACLLPSGALKWFNLSGNSWGLHAVDTAVMVCLGKAHPLWMGRYAIFEFKIWLNCMDSPSQGRHSPMGLKCNPIHHKRVANFDNKTGLASKTKKQQKKVELVSLKMSKERN